MILALLKIDVLKNSRTFMVLLALGTGQIHLAILSFMIYLFAENGFLLPRHVSRRSFSVLVGALIAIVGVTFLSKVGSRTISELVQLVLYIVVFFQLQVVLRRPGELEHLMRLSVPAAVSIALMSLAFERIGVTQVPSIYISRGSNEGSVFLLLMGVIPCAFMFLRTRNVIYILCIFIIMVAQETATSRSNVALSGACLIATAFFMWKTRWVRMVLSLAALALIYLNFNVTAETWEQQQNYSMLQRIRLYEAGLELWRQRPWTGWGWGSTSEIAPRITLTDHSFPHFHSTYVQLLVELGALGVVIIGLWLAGTVGVVLYGLYGHLPAANAAYLVLSSLALIGSGFTQALLFGADRAIQVVFLYAFILCMIAQGREKRRRTRYASRSSFPNDAPLSPRVPLA